MTPYYDSYYVELQKVKQKFLCYEYIASWDFQIRITLLQIIDLHCCGQKLVHENIVNIPANTASTVNTSPRNINNTETIKFKQEIIICVVHLKEVLDVQCYMIYMYTCL